MRQKTRWFIKPIGQFTNEAVMDLLAKSSSHQDGIAAQQIPVRGKKESLIEVPNYSVIKTIIESKNPSAPLKYEVLFMPRNSTIAKLWHLYKQF